MDRAALNEFSSTALLGIRARRGTRRCFHRAMRASAFSLIAFTLVCDARAGLPTAYRIQRAGLTRAGYTSSTGVQYSSILGVSATGQIVGTSEQYGSGNTVFTEPGRAAWVHDQATGTTSRIGLFGGVYTVTGQTLNAGQEVSEVVGARSTGFITGYSSVFQSTFSNRRSSDAWIYNPSTRATSIIGLPPATSGSSAGGGNQPNFVTPSGVVAGFLGSFPVNGGLTWVYDPIRNTTTPIGLELGLTNINNFQNSSGQVAGYYPGRQATWVYSHVTQSTVQTGLLGPDNTTSGLPGGSGYSRNFAQSESGHVVGYARRYGDFQATPTDPIRRIQIGQNTWAYLPNTRTTIPTGLTTAAYTGTSGYQFSEHSFLSSAGHAAGYSNRITGFNGDNGRHTWAFDPASQTTTRTGLVGPEYTGASGYEFSGNLLQSDSGRIAGFTERMPTASGDDARNTWFFDPVTRATTRIGLTGSIYSTPLGYQFGTADAINTTNQVAGTTTRFDNDTENGRHTWVYNPLTNTTIRTGLTGSDHTSAAGDNYGVNNFQSASGHVAGYTLRLTSAGVENGQNTWVYDPASQTSRITGLRAAIHTGSQGYQVSANSRQTSTGIIAGYSLRFADIDTSLGQDAWYFDPTTNSVIDITQGVLGGIRASDNFADSFISNLTEDGYAFGTYTYFANNAGAGVVRPFVFRPDIGFNDLVERVDGGLSAAGWASLSRVTDNNRLDLLAGYGGLPGTTSASRGVYVLVPTPSSAAIVLACVLVPSRRRQRR